jgi:tape measure domain-containing protein
VASTEDDVVVRLRLKDVARFIADVKSGKLAIDDLEKKIAKAGRTAARESDANSGGFGKLGKMLSGLKWYAMGAVGSLASAAVGVGAFAIKSAANLQQVTIAYTTLMGSASAARDTLASLRKFAIDTPFQLPTLEEAGKLLLAYKFSAQSLIPTLTAVGDAASALSLGDEGVTGIVNVLGQIKGAGVLHAQDLFQLTSRGIMAKDMLEQAFHLTPQQLDKAVSTGKISAKAAVPVILRGMEQQFKGSMATQAKTLGGVASNFVDAIRDALTNVVNPYLPALTAWLQQAVDLVGSPQFQRAMSNVFNGTIAKVKVGIQIGQQVVDSIKTAISTADWGPIGSALGTKLRDALTTTGGAAEGVDWYDMGRNAVSGGVTFILGFVSAFFDPMVWGGILKKHWVDVVFIVVAVLTDGFGGAIGKAGEALSKIPFVGRLLGGLLGTLQTGITKLGGPFRRIASGIADAFGRAFLRVFPNLGTEIWYWFSRIEEFFKDGGGLQKRLSSAIGQFLSNALEEGFTAVFRFFRRIGEMIGRAAGKLWQPIADALRPVFDWIVTRWTQLFGWLSSLPVIGGLFAGTQAPGTGGNNPQAPSQVPAGAGLRFNQRPANNAAGGTMTAGGMSWVGERGPELLNLPRGAQVIPLPRVPEIGAAGISRSRSC